MNSYASVCDDFGVSAYLHSKLDMPAGREPVLHFFEAVQRAFPSLTEFDRRADGEYMLEEDREPGSYRWCSLDARRLCTGFVNPPALDDADAHNEKILEMAPYHLDLGGLSAESVDVLYYFDLLYQGNHDEVVAEALAGGSPFEGLSQLAGGRVLNYQPSLMMALDDGCQLQARLSVETRTTSYQVRSGTFPEAPISVYFTVRQQWGGRPPFKTFADSYRNQRRVLDELAAGYVVPHVITPLQRAIAGKQ